MTGTFEYRIWTGDGRCGNEFVAREMERMHNEFGWEVVSAHPRPNNAWNQWDMVLRRQTDENS